VCVILWQDNNLIELSDIISMLNNRSNCSSFIGALPSSIGSSQRVRKSIERGKINE